MAIGDRIKERRNKLDMTSEDLAAILGKSRATIYRYENGDIKNLPTTILEPLAKALKTTPAYLMGWTDDYHDWEQIGNDEGIYPPQDYDGSYEDYVKFKINELPSLSFNTIPDDLPWNRALEKLQTGGVLTSEETSAFCEQFPNAINHFNKQLINFTKQLLESFSQLNIVNQKKSINYTQALLNIQKMEEEQDHLIPQAAHARTDIEIPEGTDTSDDDIMDSEDF